MRASWAGITVHAYGHAADAGFALVVFARGPMHETHHHPDRAATCPTPESAGPSASEWSVCNIANPVQRSVEPWGLIVSSTAFQVPLVKKALDREKVQISVQYRSKPVGPLCIPEADRPYDLLVFTPHHLERDMRNRIQSIRPCEEPDHGVQPLPCARAWKRPAAHRERSTGRFIAYHGGRT